MQEFSGIILINKPKGYTSHDVVSKVKKILHSQKVGHTGTLDPNATGVLPLLINQGTKLSKYLIEHDKEYEVTLKLGIETDTLDGEGTVLKKVEVDWKKLQPIEAVLSSFVGKQEQIPPMYSAIKVKGKKLYEYARKGETIEIEPRKIQIYSVTLQQVNKNEKEIQFQVSCSKGTYIRSLCKDIATKLGTIGYMKELKRTKVGNFSIENTITIEELETNLEKVQESFLTMQKLFQAYPKITLTQEQIQKFLNGVLLNVKKENGIYNIYAKKYIGIGIVEKGKLKRDIVEA